MPHSDCVVKMNLSQPSVSVRHSVGLTTVMLPNGFDPISLKVFNKSQQELREKYNKLRSVYEPLETQFHKLNNEAVQLKQELYILECEYQQQCIKRTSNQAAYRKCAFAEKEAKIQGLIDLNKQIEDAKKSINSAGIIMNAKIDECNRIARLRNAAGIACNTVGAQLR